MYTLYIKLRVARLSDHPAFNTTVTAGTAVALSGERWERKRNWLFHTAEPKCSSPCSQQPVSCHYPQINPVYSFPSYFSKILFNIIQPSTSYSPQITFVHLFPPSSLCVSPLPHIPPPQTGLSHQYGITTLYIWLSCSGISSPASSYFLFTARSINCVCCCCVTQFFPVGYFVFVGS